MRLKSIEIFGFKSFGKKTRIDFTGPVTAIVGPNGSGKSNIVDAVRWVLGEQRIKSLRGNKMEDVIFSGSSSKRALGYAQVSIILDNSDGMFPIDYEEISVTRRLFRSGESEYLLNNTKCRLLDIQNLFMDTGLSREGYSIISQGQIESIVSNSPQERKLLIEEAVGIVKYRTRKNDAEKKLEKATANLYRISDIISEIESRLPNMKKQAQKAETYRVLANELRDIEVSVFVNRMDMLEESRKKAVKDMEDTGYTQEEILAGINELEDEKNGLSRLQEELTPRISEVSGKVAEADEKYKTASGILASCRSQKLISEERCGIVLQETENIGNNIASLGKRAEEADFEIISRSAQLDTLKAEYDEKYARSEDARSVREKNALILSETEEKIGNVRSELEKLKENRIALEAKKENIAENIRSLSLSAEKVSSELENIRADIPENMYSGELSRKKDILEEKRALLGDITARGEKLRDEISGLFTQIQTNDSRLKLLRGYEESLQGYKYAVRKINELAAKDEYFRCGIRGILGEVISSDEKHALAISRAMGAAVEYIVTSDENVAAKAIEELKKNSWGRLTFLPQSVIKPADVYIDPSLCSMKGFVGLASDLVRCEDEFRGAVNSVLNRTIVATDLSEAGKIAKKAGYRHKIVTLDGDVIMSGGAMVGGKSKNDDGGVLARKAEISLLEKETNTRRQEYDRLLKTRSALSEEYKSVKEECDRLEKEYSDVLGCYSREEIRINNILQKISSLTASLGETEERISSYRAEDARTLQEISDAQIKYSEGEKILAELTSEKESAVVDDGEVISLIEDLSRANVAYATMKAKVDSMILARDELVSRKEELVSDLAGKQEMIRQERINIQSFDEKIAASEGEMLEISAKKDALTEELTALTEEQEKINQQVSAVNEKILSMLNDKAVVMQKYANAQNNVASIEMRIENLAKNMLESYELTYLQAKEMNLEAVEDLAMSMQRAGELKEKIKRLGNINADAIEEYENERNRFDDMCLQRDDLINSKNELSGIIEDMSKSMLDKFRKEFSVIQKQFNEVFRELFSGGEAKLILTEPDDILNSGVDIMASPPNTKLKNISALSGGEKTMTAISLIFAIIRIKPSPFIVLDEIDAALDDANVIRYCRFLRSVVGKNQFVVITHKKKTMENCDVLYGATMGNDGMTRIVSVRLCDINEKGEIS